jgi:hypothetical protein
MPLRISVSRHSRFRFRKSAALPAKRLCWDSCYPFDGRARYAKLLTAVSTLTKALETEEITAKLWIVEIGRIRIYHPEDEL